MPLPTLVIDPGGEPHSLREKPPVVLQTMMIDSLKKQQRQDTPPDNVRQQAGYQNGAAWQAMQKCIAKARTRMTYPEFLCANQFVQGALKTGDLLYKWG